MKVLFLGYKNPHFQAVSDYIELALKDMGHEVRFCDYRGYKIPGRLRDRFPALEAWDRARLNRTARALVEDFRPDLFLVNGGYTIEPETVAAARRAGAATANWIADYPRLFEVYAELVPHYDHFFASGTDALERHRELGNKNGHFLPFACLPDLHAPVELSAEERREWGSDIAFVGTAYPERAAIFERILERFPDVELALWGPGWPDLPRASPLRRHVRGGQLETSRWLKAVAATKIAFNHMGTGGSSLEPSRAKMCNSRVFELLGCGACQLVDAKDDVKRLFGQRRELVYYDGEAEMLSMIRDLLRDDAERKALGARARAAALEKHLYRHRLTDLIAICGGGKP